MLEPGDVIAGKYRVERILGEGGMGYVLGARNIALDEPVAIKILKPAAVTDAEAVARFLREARASVRMRGEHVAKVLDVGALGDGTPYMLMELLEGSDLSTVVERAGWLPVQTAVDYVLQICEALAEAHALGIVHRDIKPSNLFLTTGVDGLPCVKVLDFGISKATNAIDATRPDFGLTQTQTVMGSPQYMAPEQMRSSRRVDGRTDIWGLGTIMHELLTGQPPFAATSMPELFAMILQDAAPSMRVRRPDVPPGLDAIALRCLEKSPDARPASVLELAHMLMPFAGPLSAGAAERVGRVGRSVANASATLIAERESGRTTIDPTPQGLRRPQAVAAAAQNIAPSAPEMAHASTMRFANGAPPRPNRTGLVVLLAAVATVVLGGAAAAWILARGHDKTSVTTPTGASSVAPAMPLDLPPAIDPLPPATYHAPSEPPSAEPSASPPPLTTTKRGADAGLHRPPSVAASSSSIAPPSVAPTPPKPAATASSRFD